MNISLQGTGFELTESIKIYTESKLQSLDKFLTHSQEDANRVSVELSKISPHHNKGDIFRTEINLVSDGKAYRAEASGEDLYASIDTARDEIVRQITSGKMKRESLLRRGARAAKRILTGS